MNENTLVAFIYIFMSVISAMMLYLIIGFIYSMIICYKQSKKFINHLKIGDNTNYGKISSLDGDFVIINRDPLRIQIGNIQPDTFKANKFLFIFPNRRKS